VIELNVGDHGNIGVADVGRVERPRDQLQPQRPPLPCRRTRRMQPPSRARTRSPVCLGSVRSRHCPESADKGVVGDVRAVELKALVDLFQMRAQYVPTDNPQARRIAAVIRDVEPLPFVPVT